LGSSAGFFTTIAAATPSISVGQLTVSFTVPAAVTATNCALLALTGTDNWYAAKDNTADGFYGFAPLGSIGAIATITLKIGTTVPATQTISATSNKPIAWKCYKVGPTDGASSGAVDSVTGICTFTFAATTTTPFVAAVD